MKGRSSWTKSTPILTVRKDETHKNGLHKLARPTHDQHQGKNHIAEKLEKEGAMATRAQLQQRRKKSPMVCIVMFIVCFF